MESDLELLGRVLRNLLANALRYTQQGSVTIEARAVEGKIVLSISDTGVGIPPAAQEKVFEEFYQVGNPERDREQGLGLGLSIVRGICRTLEHRVTLISQPQREVGTEFLVEVPVGDPSRVIEKQPARPSLDPGFPGKRVLVIDDEKDVREGMSALLQSWNCVALCAGSLAMSALHAKAYTAPMSRMGLVLVVVFILIGPTPLVIGAVATWRALAAHREQVNAQAGWTETVAEVTACSAYNPSKSPGQWPYTFKSEWKDTKGQVHPGAGSGNTCRTGERYAIQYNPENPKQFSTPVGPFVPIPLILCLIGAAFIGIAIREWRKAKAK